MRDLDHIDLGPPAAEYGPKQADHNEAEKRRGHEGHGFTQVWVGVKQGNDEGTHYRDDHRRKNERLG